MPRINCERLLRQCLLYTDGCFQWSPVQLAWGVVPQIGFKNGLNTMGLNLSLDDMQDLFNRCCGRALCGWKHDLLNQLDIVTLMLETSFDYLGLTSAIEWVMTVWDKLLVTSWTRFGTIHSESLESWMWNGNMKVVTVICAVSLPVFQTRYPYMSMVKVRRSRIKQKHKQIYLST